MRSYLFLGNKKCRIYAVLWRFANAYLLYNFVRTKKSLQLKIDIAAKIMTNIVKEVIVQDAFLQKEN